MEYRLRTEYSNRHTLFLIQNSIEDEIVKFGLEHYVISLIFILQYGNSVNT